MKTPYAVLCVAYFVACSSSQSNQEELLIQAATIHNESLAMAESLKKILNEQPLEPRDSVENLLQAIDTWEKDLVEVPGNEHDPHTNHTHQHDHTPLLITPAEMVIIQNELKHRMEDIQKRSKKLRLLK